MPRLPKPPGANKPAPISALLDAIKLASHHENIDLLAALAAAGQHEAAEALLGNVSRFEGYRAEPLAWMSWCCQDEAQAKRWADEAEEVWAAFLKTHRSKTLPRHRAQSGWSAMALIADDPAPRLKEAHAVIGERRTVLPLARTLLALDRLEEAVALLEREKSGDALQEGIGWGTGLLHRYSDGFQRGLLHRLVHAQRWDLLGRICRTLMKHDGVFLGSMCLNEVLAGRSDAAEAIAVMPPEFQRSCFLSAVAHMPAADRPSLAAILPTLPPHRRAIGELLVGDPDRVTPDRTDALLAQSDDDGRAWDPIIVGMLRGDADALSQATSGHTIRRAGIGGLRALHAQGDDAALKLWTARLREAALADRDPSERPQVLGEFGRVLGELGHQEAADALLMEAFVLAEALPRSDQGWSRHNALERVGCFSIRAGSHAAALKSLQKCTSKYRRPTLVRRLAIRYVEAGDYAGAARILSFTKPDDPYDYYTAAQWAAEALVPGWTARFNPPRR